jgi:hypothetical protein
MRFLWPIWAHFRHKNLCTYTYKLQHATGGDIFRVQTLIATACRNVEKIFQSCLNIPQVGTTLFFQRFIHNLHPISHQQIVAEEYGMFSETVSLLSSKDVASEGTRSVHKRDSELDICYITGF